MLTTEQEKKELRERYAEEYKELTGAELMCFEKDITSFRGHSSFKRYGPAAKQQLLRITSDYMDIPVEEIVKKSRKPNVLLARQMMSYLLGEMKITSGKIGEILGQDHTTVLNSLQNVKGYLSVDSGYKSKYEDYKHYCIERLKPTKTVNKLSPEQEKAIRDSVKKGGISLSELAEIYDVGKTTIWKVANGKYCKTKSKKK